MKLTLTISLLVACAVRAGDVRVSLALDGYCRVGRYTTFAIETPAAKVVKLSGEGLLPLRIEAQGQRVSGVFPVLVLDTPGREIRIDVDGAVTTIPVEFRPLGESERLVGVIGGHEEIAKNFFPGKSSIAVRLDRLGGSPALWDALDAVVSDSRSAFGDQLIGPLLAAGTRLVVRSAGAPDQPWPWRREGEVWVLSYDALGPQTIFSESAYTPVLNWSPGALPVTRVESVLFAILFSILALAAALLEKWWRIAAVTAVVVIAAVLFAVFAQRQGGLREITGQIIVTSPKLWQRDLWEYQTRVRPGQAIEQCIGLTRPVLTSAQQALDEKLELLSVADGQVMLFTWTGGPGKKMAFLKRSVDVPPPFPMQVKEVSSPLRVLADELYVGPGARVVGDEATQQQSRLQYQERWPTVVIDRDAE